MRDKRYMGSKKAIRTEQMKEKADREAINKVPLLRLAMDLVGKLMKKGGTKGKHGSHNTRRRR